MQNNPQQLKALVSSHYKRNMNVKQENPNEIANKILNEYLEGKSFGFIKEVCESVLSVFDEKELTKTEIENHKTTSENLLELHQLVQQTLRA